jgi:hypothetical protein
VPRRREGWTLIKWVLFLAAVFVSLPTCVLADEVGFQDGMGSGNIVNGVAVPNGLSRAGFLNGALIGAEVSAGHFAIPGNGQSALGIAGENFDAPSRPGFSSIVPAEDGVISISVPEPETMGTLATGLAMIAGLMGLKGSKSKCFLH